MTSNHYVLSMTKEAAGAITSGEAYRDGGLVRRNNGTILEYLKDGNQRPDEWLDLKSTAVPLAVNALTMIMIMKRLDKIEAQLGELKADVQRLQRHVKLLDMKQDALLLGRPLGALQACAMEIDEGRCSEERMLKYREEFLQAASSYRMLLNDMLSSSGALPFGAKVARRYLDAYVLFTIAARDLSIRLGEIPSARQQTENTALWLNDFSDSARRTMRTPAALAHFQPGDFCLVASAAEANARLRGHLEMEELKVLPKAANPTVLVRP